MTTRVSLFVAFFLLFLTVEAGAQTGIDAQENLFGATNINATTGHGGLTAGISAEGDLTVLSWPGPSYNDQLGYRTSNDLDAREQPRFGALEGAGLFLGLRCELDDGEVALSWLRDEGWSREQDYGEADGPNPHTRFHNASLGLSVEVVDAIAPEADLFVRQVSVERVSESPVSACWLLTYANLSPLPPNSRLPELPVVDWIKDGDNDFAAVWDDETGAIIHFHPDDQRIMDDIVDLLVPGTIDWGPIGEALLEEDLTNEELGALVDGLAESYGDGSWLILGTVPAADQHQIGFDGTPLCDQLEELRDNVAALPEVFPGFEPPLDPETLDILSCARTTASIIEREEWVYPAEDALTDAEDGELSGADLAAGEINEALRTPLDFAGGTTARASVLLGAGGSLADARAAYSTGSDPAAVVQAAEETLAAWLEPLTIPGAEGSRVRTVARRSLINVRVGTDGATGAVVASIARQPPYALDWPRDGAFFNVMLDASGQRELVERRLEAYTEWQRDEAVEPTLMVDPEPPVDPDTGASDTYPADAWEMNFYSDGEPGGVFRFEIDTTAFALWTIVAHSGWADDPVAHLEQRWDTIERAAELLTRWRDESTGLPAPAQEDDSAGYTQTLHGAITVFGALDIAARGARLLGRDEAAERWEARALEVRAAIETNFYDAEEGVFFMSESGRLPIMASGLIPVGPTAWLVWPCTLYPFDDPRIQRQLRRDYEVIEPVMNLETNGGLYYMKNTISIALAGDRGLTEVIAGLPELLAGQATTDTDHFGEVMVVVEEEGERRPQQRVSTPHLWEGTLFYLTALAAEQPDALLRYNDVLPVSRVVGEQRPAAGEGDGCSCRSTSQRPGGPVLGLLIGVVLLTLLGVRRRRHRLRDRG